MQKYQNNIAARNGDAVVGIKVLITLGGAATPATIYSEDGVTPTPNPLHTDANGYFEFYAADGRYDIYVGGKQAYTDVLLADSVVLSEEVLAARDEVIPAAAQAVAARDEAVPAAATATAQAVFATTQAGISGVQASAAATSAANAEDSAVEASASAAAASAAGHTYTTTAEGITATTDGQLFLQKTADPQVYNVWTNVSGVAVAGGTVSFASVGAVDALEALVSIGNPAAPNIVEYIDVNGSIVAAISATGDLLIPGFEGGLRPVVEDLYAKSPGLGLAMKETDLAAMYDDEGKIFLLVDEDAEVFVPGLEGLSIQAAIKGGSQADVDFALASTRTFRHTFGVEAAAVLATRAESGTGKSTPAPMNLLPGAFHISADVTNAFTVAQPARTPINTPYFADDGVVHPNLIEFYNGYRGYRYWCMINPYRNTNSTYENPVAYGTNDFTTFDIIPDIPAPLAPFEPPYNYNADNGFAYNPLTGELIVFWIQFQYPNSTIGRYRTTRDGINFGPRGDLFPLTNLSDESMVSPALLYNPKTGYWHLYTQGVTGAYNDVPRKLRVRFSRHFNGPWSAPTEIATPVAARPWHQEVKYIGDKFFILCANAPIGNLFLGQSDDGINFTFGTTPILTGNVPCYKGSFVPVFQDEQMALRLVWTSAGGHPTNPALGWDLYTAQTNFVTIG